METEAEAESGKRVPLPLPLWPFISNLKNLNVEQFFVKYTTKSECFINHHLQRNIFKVCSSFRPGAAPTPTNLKMNHIAN